MKPILKRLLFHAGLLLMAVLLLEIAALVAYGVSRRRVFPYREYHSWMDAASRQPADEPITDPGAFQRGRQIIHPYMGYVYNPTIPGVSEYGFIDDQNPIRSPSAALTVAVMGGSFAAHLCMYAETPFAHALQSLRDEVVIVNLALGGFKQPQQLMALAYLFSLGAHFDVVVNIDGFNEIALPTAENIPEGVFPLYPRQWRLRLKNIREAELSMDLLRLDAIRSQTRRIASIFEWTPLSRSAVGCLFWRMLDRRQASRERAALQRLGDLNLDSRPSVTGPPFTLKNANEIYSFLAAHWARCSLLMDSLCRSKDVPYFHFLQPNQYVSGSKPIGEEETRIAINPDHPYRRGVVRGYPHLRQMGRILSSRIHFHDMTMIFADNDAVLYSDNCCHLNGGGYALFVEAIGNIIVDALAPRALPPAPLTGPEYLDGVAAVAPDSAPAAL